MTTLILTAFGGMIPRLGKQSLPEGAASLAENALLLSGELRGLHDKIKVKDLRDFSGTIRRVFRLSNGVTDTWAAFDDETTHLVKCPLVNDLHDRYYKSSDIDQPKMNTLTGIGTAAPYYLLGVPRPANAPTVVPSGGSGPTVSRAYTYTFVSSFGEEGPPAEAVVATGNDDGDWLVSGLDTVIPVDRNIISKNIYRTITANNGIADYHFVANVLIGTTSYNDTYALNPTSKVSLNPLLQSEEWVPPPPTLTGLIVHPNGFLVGFSGRDIYFSEPYRPHAWPAGYVLSTQDTIVGLATFGSTLAVITTGFPYMINGIHPSNLSFVRAETPEACVASRRSIVPMPFGVYFPSTNGLVLLSANGFQNATKPLLTKDEWQLQYAPSTIEAVRWQNQYVAFNTTTTGFMFDPDEAQAAFVALDNDAWNHEAFQTDQLSGDAYLVSGNVVYVWNPPYGQPQTYLWRSKEYVTPKPVNFGALKVDFDGTNPIDPRFIAQLLEDNELRFPYPLNPLNFAALNSVRKVSTIAGFTPPPPLLENSQPMHKSPLYVVPAPDATFAANLTLRVYADGMVVFESAIEDFGSYRLPSGFKAIRWMVEIEGNITVRSVKVAETNRELMSV